MCIALVCLAAAAQAESWQGACVNVLDGDSLLVAHKSGRKEVRLKGIDAPEFDQPYGTEASDCLRALVLRQTVTVEPFAIDAYGRTIAKVYISGECVNERLLAQGCAWLYTRFCTSGDLKAWKSLEKKARDGRLGLWSQPDPRAPWDFRRSKRTAEQQQGTTRAQADGFYRGNTSSFVVHAPGCAYAACKNCTQGFNSIGAALRAGYRPCKKCIE